MPIFRIGYRRSDGASGAIVLGSSDLRSALSALHMTPPAVTITSISKQCGHELSYRRRCTNLTAGEKCWRHREVAP